MRRQYITDGKHCNANELQKEQRRVYDILCQMFPQAASFAVPRISWAHIKSGQSAFVDMPLSMDQLPSEDWVWRQSNARVTVSLNPYVFATMVKVNSRKTYPTGTHPSLKCWIIQLELPNQVRKWFFHCEKGLPSAPAVEAAPSPTESVAPCLDTDLDQPSLEDILLGDWTIPDEMPLGIEDVCNLPSWLDEFTLEIINC